MMTLSSGANVARRRRVDDQPPAREPLAPEIVRIPLEAERDAARHERAEALAGGAGELDADRVVGQPLAAVTAA